MNWININVETINSIEFIASSPTERSTWLSLLAWCCLQENDGTIIGCKSWGSRMWQQLCGVTLEEVTSDCGLFQFDGENLIVGFYPLSQQAAVSAKREAGKKGGRPKALQGKEENHMVNHKDKDTLNGKERKVIVKESNSNIKEGDVDIYKLPSLDEVVKYGKSIPCCTDEMAEIYYYNRDAVGWVAKNSNLVVSNWKSDLEGFIMIWARNEHNMGKTTQAPKKLSDGVNNKYVPQPPITDEEAKQGAAELRKMLGMDDE